ncbi:hypothetical protein [Aquimarina agarilytica]|uniref:hypothetical protein n=1 Tax=Aquimarina agarilytica TaxID=1087449 RepID=UPI000288FC3C|nr:hypothetical protein [Aquimarina agarilytica]
MEEYVFIHFVIKFKDNNTLWFKKTNVLERILKPIKKLSLVTTLNDFYDDFEVVKVNNDSGIDNVLKIKDEGFYSIADNRKEINNKIEFFIDKNMLNIDFLINLNGDVLQNELKEFVILVDELHSIVQNDLNLYALFTPIEIHSKALKYPLPPKETFGHLTGLCFNKNDEIFLRNFPIAYQLIKHAKIPSSFQVIERDYGFKIDFLPETNDPHEVFKNIIKGELWLSNLLNRKIDENFNELGDKKTEQKVEHVGSDFVGTDENGAYHYYYVVSLDKNSDVSIDKRWDEINSFIKNPVDPEYNNIIYSYINLTIFKRENAVPLLEKTKLLGIHKIYYVENETDLSEKNRTKILWEVNPFGNWLTEEEEAQLLRELKG